MQDELEQLEHRERNRFGAGCVIAVFIFLPILYALSPPFVVLIFDLPPEADNTLFRAVYAPIGWLGEQTDIVRDFYTWYFRLFGLDA